MNREINHKGFSLVDDRKRIAQFLIVGTSNTLVSFGLYSLLLNIVPPTPAMAGLSQAASYCAGILWSYFFNKMWVFEVKRDSKTNHFWRFLVVQLGLMIGSSLAIGIGVRMLGGRQHELWLVVMIFATALNFIILRQWVFRSNEQN